MKRGQKTAPGGTHATPLGLGEAPSRGLWGLQGMDTEGPSISAPGTAAQTSAWVCSTLLYPPPNQGQKAASSPKEPSLQLRNKPLHLENPIFGKDD